MIIADGDRSLPRTCDSSRYTIPLGKRCKKKGTQRRVVGKIEVKNSRKGYNFYICIIIDVISIPSYRNLYDRSVFCTKFIDVDEIRDLCDRYRYVRR